MQISSQTMSQGKINSLKKRDDVTLALKNNNGKITYFVATIKEITSDVPRCNGCKIRLDNKESFKFGSGYYCEFCYKRRKEKQRKITDESSKKRHIKI